MTLKSPPEDLQIDLRPVKPDYFTSEGDWNPEKATFRLQKALQHPEDPARIFRHLPIPLLDLLTSILRHERSLKFTSIAEPLSYLTDPTSTGRRYLPHGKL